MQEQNNAQNNNKSLVASPDLVAARYNLIRKLCNLYGWEFNENDGDCQNAMNQVDWFLSQPEILIPSANQEFPRIPDSVRNACRGTYAMACLDMEEAGWIKRSNDIKRDKASVLVAYGLGNPGADVDDEYKDAFKLEVVALMRKYGLSIGHEDEHGAFLIIPLDENDIGWFLDAGYHTTVEPNITGGQVPGGQENS